MANADIIIADEKLLPQAVELYNNIFRPKREVDYFKRRFMGRYNCLTLLARLGDKPVGFWVGFELKPGMFYHWLGAVTADMRRNGIGRQLQEAHPAQILAIVEQVRLQREYRLIDAGRGRPPQLEPNSSIQSPAAQHTLADRPRRFSAALIAQPDQPLGYPFERHVGIGQRRHGHEPAAAQVGEHRGDHIRQLRAGHVSPVQAERGARARQTLLDEPCDVRTALPQLAPAGAGLGDESVP